MLEVTEIVYVKRRDKPFRFLASSASFRSTPFRSQPSRSSFGC